MNVQKLIDQISPYGKAIVAFLAPGLLLVAGIMASDGRWPTTSEVLMAIGVSVVTALGVYAVPNKAKIQ